MIQSMKAVALSVIAVGFLASCGGQSPQSSNSGSASGPSSDSTISEKATTSAPVFRFAKISTGAYFYTADATEAEQINQSFPDFRYEGVAFQHLTSGGLPVYRFAKLDTGGYFYTASEAERAQVIAQFSSTFRFEGVSFYAVASGGQVVYRLSNANNGAYLYTTSADEYAYAGSLPGWSREGPAFNVPSGLQISGTVSDGLPWAQANVTVIDKNGVTRTGTTSTIGTYFVDAAGLTAPVMAMATYRRPGAISEYMMAQLPALPSNTTSTTMNITPLTTLVVQYAGVQTGDHVAGLQNPSGWWPIADMVSRNAEAVGAIRTVLASQLVANGIPSTDYDPTKLAFAANQTGQAAVVRDVNVSFTGNGAWFSNRRTGDNAAASIYVTSTNISLPPALPSDTKPVFPVAVLNTLKTAWQACLSISASLRISFDGAGKVNGVHPTCASVATADYKQSGDTFGERWRDVLSDASVTASSYVEAKFGGYADLDGKFLATVYVRFLGSNNVPVNMLEVLVSRGGNWVVAGNQRLYNGAIVSRLTKVSQIQGVSPALEYSASALLLLFDPSHPSLSGVRAVRVRGPGLPGSGVVLTRSAQCGTGNYMTITNKTGQAIDFGGNPVDSLVYNKQASPTFNLGRVVNIGTANWPAPGTVANFADANTTTPAAIVPPLSRYTIEYFDFTVGSGVPIASYTTPLTGTVFNPNTMESSTVTPTAGFIAKYLSPSGANAAAQPTSVAFEWNSSSLYQPNVATLQSFSITRNFAQTDSFMVDYAYRAASYDPIRVAADITQATKPFSTAAQITGASTNATVAATVGAQNTTCASQPMLRSINNTSDYRDFTFRMLRDDLSQIQYVKSYQN
jgi:hypothetical protein